MCPTRLGPWAADFLERHPDLTDPDAQMLLVSKSAVAKEETLAIEKRNGHFRWFLTTKSNMKRTCDLPALNDWLVGELPRVDAQAVERAEKQKEKEERRQAKSRKPVRKRKHTTWSLFISREKTGLRPVDWPSGEILSARYAIIKNNAVQWAELKAAVAHANAELVTDGPAHPARPAPARTPTNSQPTPAPPNTTTSSTTERKKPTHDIFKY